MERENLKNKKIEPTFPEESSLVIEKILEKYGLVGIQEEGIKKILKATTLDERMEIFENLPGAKIAKLVRDYAIEKIALIDIPKKLEEELAISREDAEGIARDLEDNLLVLIDLQKKTSLPEIKEISQTEITSPKVVSSETSEIPPKKDIYREPIEPTE